jgi:uncharacterized protein YkwD
MKASGSAGKATRLSRGLILHRLAPIALGPLLLIAFPGPGSARGQRDPALDRWEAAVLEKVNAHRRALLMSPLVADSSLRALAREHSERMAAGEIPLDHRGFEARIEGLGRPYLRAAENAASNRGFDDPASQAVGRWVGSPEHRRNIEGDFNLTGIGAARSANGTCYFTQIFLKDAEVYGVFR